MSKRRRCLTTSSALTALASALASGGCLADWEPAAAQVPAPPRSDAPVAQAQATVDTLHRHWVKTHYNDTRMFRPTLLLATRWNEVWVVDVGDRSVYRWSTDGEELPQVGRSGAGPGEYMLPGLLVQMADDSVGVWDRQLQRMSFFGKSGEFLSDREIALSTDSHGFMTAAGFRNDTTLVMAINYAGLTPRPLDNRAVLWRFVGADLRADSLLSMPGTRMTFFRQAGYGTGYLAPFTPHAYAFFLSNRVLVGYGGNDEIAVYDDDMKQLARVALGLPLLAVTRQDKTRFADSLSQVLEDNVTRSDVGPSEGARMRALNRRIVARLNFPSTHPRYVDAFLGVDGLLWFRPATESSAEHLEWRGYAIDTFRHVRSVYLPNDDLVLNTRTDGRSFFVTKQDELGQSYLAKYSVAGGDPLVPKGPA